LTSSGGLRHGSHNPKSLRRQLEECRVFAGGFPGTV
jgi:hypothetical protein